MKASSKFVFYSVALVSVCLIEQSRAGAQKVIVNNATSNPVPVAVQNSVSTRRADEPALQPYHESLEGPLDSSQYFGSFTFTIPVGKRLVIELITAAVQVPAGQNVWGGDVATYVGVNGKKDTLTLIAQGQDIGGATWFAGTHSIHSYSDGSVIVTVYRNASTGGWNAHASVSGYLIDLP